MSRNAKVKVLPEYFRQVPDGYRIRYKHHYVRHIHVVAFGKILDLEDILKSHPPQLIATEAWAVDEVGNEVAETRSVACVHPNDTAIKKLGRLKAHNRVVRKLEAILNHDNSTWYEDHG